jgi:hypothetical protein
MARARNRGVCSPGPRSRLRAARTGSAAARSPPPPHHEPAPVPRASPAAPPPAPVPLSGTPAPSSPDSGTPWASQLRRPGSGTALHDRGLTSPPRGPPPFPPPAGRGPAPTPPAAGRPPPAAVPADREPRPLPAAGPGRPLPPVGHGRHPNRARRGPPSGAGDGARPAPLGDVAPRRGTTARLVPAPTLCAAAGPAVRHWAGIPAWRSELAAAGRPPRGLGPVTVRDPTGLRTMDPER